MNFENSIEIMEAESFAEHYIQQIYLYLFAGQSKVAPVVASNPTQACSSRPAQANEVFHRFGVG